MPAKRRQSGLRFRSTGKRTETMADGKPKSDAAKESAAHVDLRRVNGEETRQRIIDAAQLLFAKNGYAGVSMRQITMRAKANVAAIHYHLGSKEQLLLEVLRRGAGPLVERRNENLRALKQPYRLEDVIRAFVSPVFGNEVKSSAKQLIFGELRARLMFENSSLVERMLSELFDDSTVRFIEALRECLPDTPESDIYFRFHYMLGAMTYTMSGLSRVKTLSGGRYDPAKGPGSLDQLVTFLTAGFRAPSIEQS